MQAAAMADEFASVELGQSRAAFRSEAGLSDVSSKPKPQASQAEEEDQLVDLSVAADRQAEELEELQAAQGLRLLSCGLFLEAEEFFAALEEMRPNPRFSLHRAESAALHALLTMHPEELQRANRLLQDCERQAGRLETAWRELGALMRKEHMKAAVTAGISTMKTAAKSAAETSIQTAKLLLAKLKQPKGEVQVTPVAVEESDAPPVSPGTEIDDAEQRRREWERQKACVRATLVQAEACLLQGLIALALGGEAALEEEGWIPALKVGLGVRKAWQLYQQCQKTLSSIAAAESRAKKAERERLEKENREEEKRLARERQAEKDREVREQGGFFAAATKGVMTKLHKVLGKEDEGEVIERRKAIAELSEQSWGSNEDEPGRLHRTSDGETLFGRSLSSQSRSAHNTHKEDPEPLVKDSKEGDVDEDIGIKSMQGMVDFGLGLLQMMVPLIPAKLQRTSELLGFDGHRTGGLETLERVAAGPTHQAPLAAIALLYYHTVLMSLLPRSLAHSRDAKRILASLRLTWHDTSAAPAHALSCLLSARRLRYEGELTEAIQALERARVDASDDSAAAQLTSPVLYELGWCHLLSADFAAAADTFASLHTVPPSEDGGDTRPLGSAEQEPWALFYTCLEAACCWDAGPSHHPRACTLMRELAVLGGVSGVEKTAAPAKEAPAVVPESAAEDGGSGLAPQVTPPSRGVTPSSPLEVYFFEVCEEFLSSGGQAPLFPALELALLWNGFQQMSRAVLEGHLATVQAVFAARGVSWGDKLTGVEVSLDQAKPKDDSSEGSQAQAPEGLAEGSTEAGVPAGVEEADSPVKQEEAGGEVAVTGRKEGYGHRWGLRSEMLCRLLLGSCHKYLGESEKAAEELAYVISAGHSLDGHLVPFACYELGSMLLHSAKTAHEGQAYLEQAAAAKQHAFQGRLKFIIHERLRRYREEKT